MTGTVMFESISNHSCSFPLEEIESIYGRSYYKFYQLKLRQVLTETRHRLEHDPKCSKQKLSKTQANDKQFHKEYMNHLREKMRILSQNIDNGKRSSSVLSGRSRRPRDSITFSVTSTNISTTTNTSILTESKPKSILKTKQTSSPTKRQRVTSAPANSQKNIHKKTPLKIPTIKIDHADDNLSRSNGSSYTQASSSSQDHIHRNHQYARQSILNTIMLHLNSYTPSDISKWNLYREFDDKISASICPTVYRNFERIIL